MKRSLRVLGVTTSLTPTKADRFLVYVAKKELEIITQSKLVLGTVDRRFSSPDQRLHPYRRCPVDWWVILHVSFLQA